MVRNKNPCFIETQREFCETHHIFYGVVLPAELTDVKRKHSPVSFLQLMHFPWCVEGA